MASRTSENCSYRSHREKSQLLRLRGGGGVTMLLSACDDTARPPLQAERAGRPEQVLSYDRSACPSTYTGHLLSFLRQIALESVNLSKKKCLNHGAPFFQLHPQDCCWPWWLHYIMCEEIWCHLLIGVNLTGSSDLRGWDGVRSYFWSCSDWPSTSLHLSELQFFSYV